MVIGHSLASADGSILAIDETVADLLWRPVKTVIGMSYLDLTHADDRSRNHMQVSDLRQGRGPLSIRKRYLREDGAIVLIDLEVSRFKTGSDAGHLVGSFRLPAMPEPAGDPADDPRRLWQTARFLASFERLRKEGLGDDLYGDACWSILLHVYLAEAEGRRIGEPDLRRATGLPPVLLARWLAVLEQRGLIDARVPPCGSRQLTRSGILTLEPLFARLGDAAG